MRILFTGGGTGGHFYPIIAITEKVNEIIDKEHILKVGLYYMSDTPYDKEALYNNSMEFIKVTSGKLRTYFSLNNLLDVFKTIAGVINALFQVYSIYPDVVVGKGGYASFPALFAARILRIPVILHESDSVPGRVNRWAGKFAKRIAISYEEAGQYFPKDKVAWTGQPIRREIQYPAKEGMYEYLKLNPAVPTILILGGSQGAEAVNNVVLDILPRLLDKYQIIHQAGEKNLKDIKAISQTILADHPHKDRYRPFGFLNTLALKMAAGASTLIISRAGSALFEIASWGVPSIIIPLPNSHGDHQRKNAYNYERAGGCTVIEEKNIEPTIFLTEIEKLMTDEEKRNRMREAALAFVKRDAAEKIAKEVVSLALTHER